MISHSVRETKRLAATLVQKILASRLHQKHARVVALIGELGAGKTTFVQGFAKALGIRHRVASPTFLIFRPYTLNANPYTLFYHVDVYRIHDPAELSVLKFKEILSDPRNIVLIEWAEKIKKLLPKDTIWVRFAHRKKEHERHIDFGL